MHAFTTKPLQHGEVSWAILAQVKGVTTVEMFEQERILREMPEDLASLARREGLDPRQVLARAKLIERNKMPREKATAYVRKCSPGLSAILDEALTMAKDPIGAFTEFQRQTRIMV